MCTDWTLRGASPMCIQHPLSARIYEKLTTHRPCIQGTTLALRLAAEGGPRIATSLSGIVLLGAASSGNAVAIPPIFHLPNPLLQIIQPLLAAGFAGSALHPATVHSTEERHRRLLGTSGSERHPKCLQCLDNNHCSHQCLKNVMPLIPAEYFHDDKILHGYASTEQFWCVYGQDGTNCSVGQTRWPCAARTTASSSG